jgi:hypothetical protein
VGHAGEGALELAAPASGDPERQKELRRRQLQLRIGEAAAAKGLAKLEGTGLAGGGEG